MQVQAGKDMFLKKCIRGKLGLPVKQASNLHYPFLDTNVGYRLLLLNIANSESSNKFLLPAAA